MKNLYRITSSFQLFINLTALYKLFIIELFTNLYSFLQEKLTELQVFCIFYKFFTALYEFLTVHYKFFFSFLQEQFKELQVLCVFYSSLQEQFTEFQVLCIFSKFFAAIYKLFTALYKWSLQNYKFFTVLCKWSLQNYKFFASFTSIEFTTVTFYRPEIKQIKAII